MTLYFYRFQGVVSPPRLRDDLPRVRPRPERRPRLGQVPLVRQGVLRPVQRQLAPGGDVRAVRAEAGGAEQGRLRAQRFRRRGGLRGRRLGGAEPGQAGGRHQAVPDVPRADRAGRRVRADDVQALQARLLLVLPDFARREFTKEKEQTTFLEKRNAFISFKA